MRHGILNKAKHLLFAGKSGTGKTQGAINYLLGSDHDRVAIFDHQGEFAVRLGVPLALTWDDFWKQFQTQRIVCYDYTEEFGGSRDEIFSAWCEALLQVCNDVLEPKGLRCLGVVDEIQIFCSPQNLPQAFSACLDTGRRRLLDTMSLSQRPNSMHPALREQFTEIFMFKLDEPSSLDFAEKIGFAREDIVALPFDPPGHYLYRNRQNGRTATGVISFPQLTNAPTGE